jgi:hypothetical protein
MQARFTVVGALVVLAGMGVGLVAPAGTARASDAGKVIAAIAAGALVYKLVDDYEDRHEARSYYDRDGYGCHRGPEYYHRPSSSRDRYIYNRGYEDGFDDGYRYGWRDGDRHGKEVGYRWGYGDGYGDGRRDQWVVDRYGGRAYWEKPVCVGPWPIF